MTYAGVNGRRRSSSVTIFGGLALTELLAIQNFARFRPPI